MALIKEDQCLGLEIDHLGLVVDKKKVLVWSIPYVTIN